MSLERVLKTLEAFGLSRTDAKVYVYLSKKGPKRVRELAEALQLTRRQLYLCLKKLKNKSLVTASPERPRVYSAVAFEEVLDLLIRFKMEQAEALKTKKAVNHT